MEVLEQLSLAGLVPVIKVEDAADAVPLCRALSDGGLPVAEITFRTDAAEEAIRRVHDELPDVVLGAGTVLTCEQADRAMAAGASYIVSPGLNPEVVRHCISRGVAVVPGCASPTDIETALSLGLDTVKIFPAEALGGLPLIKAMSAPYGGVRFMPTGGVNERNMLDYLAFPKIVCVGGSWMVPADAVAGKDWARITALTRAAVDAMLGLQLHHVGVNSGSPEAAARDAALFCALLGWAPKDGPHSVFSGTGIELLKEAGPGTNGHIGIVCNDVRRAQWHLERRGFAFDPSGITMKNGRPYKVYLRDEIAGFAVHLIQKK